VVWMGTAVGVSFGWVVETRMGEGFGGE